MTHGDQELQLYLADDVYVQDGDLILRTRRNPTFHGSKLYNWTSGWVDTEHKFSHQFGRFEIKAKLPNPKVQFSNQMSASFFPPPFLPTFNISFNRNQLALARIPSLLFIRSSFSFQSAQIWPAHWLMPEPETAVPPNVCWPVGGEIDILESWGASYNNTARGTLHFAEACGKDLRAGPNGGWPPPGQPEIDYSQDYHVFAVEWDASCIKWFMDEHMYWQRYQGDEPAPHGARIPQTPFYVILNTAISWWTHPIGGDAWSPDMVMEGDGVPVGFDPLMPVVPVGFDPLMPVVPVGFDPLMPVYHIIDHVRVFEAA